jgi:tetratricopeptide (TPR) repeat protein
MFVRLLLVVAAPIVFSLPVAGAAQSGSWTRQPQNKQHYDSLVEYNKLVTAFRAGDDGPAQAIAFWPNKQVLAMVALLPPAPLKFPPWDAGQFKAAVMLHTTTALNLLGTADRSEGALLHLQVGTEILRRGGKDVPDFVGPWHTAIARLLMNRANLEVLAAFLERARERFPDDPTIQFLSGVFAEFMAGPSSFEELAPSAVSFAKMPQALERMSKRRTGRLDEAARFLGAALGAGGHDAEMLLHAARVEMLRNHDDEAVRMFRDIDGSAATRTDWRYLAALFAGGLHERTGRIDDAMASYRRAAAILPAAQSARVALSEVLRRAGRAGESAQMLRDAVAARRPPAVDPWWTYFLEDPDLTAARLKRLLAEARR